MTGAHTHLMVFGVAALTCRGLSLGAPPEKGNILTLHSVVIFILVNFEIKYRVCSHLLKKFVVV